MRTEAASLGTLRIKMRLRKPIQEAMRYYRDMTEVRDATRAASATGSGKDAKAPRAGKVTVTIEIPGCRDLRGSHGDVSQIAPFFYYQFYTFDERYSHTGAGPNPLFNDARSYTLAWDDGTVKYLETQSLDIILFDDSAPMSGIERGGQASGGGQEIEDMIGVCKIPLADLAKRNGIDGDFDVRGRLAELRGKVRVKIVISDAGATGAGAAKARGDALDGETGSYGTSWEKDVIKRIAKKLGRLSIDVDLMFGIFSRGRQSCDREDFKWCCLQRL